jgi:hypothetical protein
VGTLGASGPVGDEVGDGVGRATARGVVDDSMTAGGAMSGTSVVGGADGARTSLCVDGFLASASWTARAGGSMSGASIVGRAHAARTSVRAD